MNLFHLFVGVDPLLNLRGREPFFCGRSNCLQEGCTCNKQLPAVNMNLWIYKDLVTKGTKNSLTKDPANHIATHKVAQVNQIWHKNEQTQVFTLWFRRSWNFWHVLQTKTESISSRLTGIPGNSQNEVPLWPSYQILLGLTIKSTFESITTHSVSMCIHYIHYILLSYIYHLVI